MLSYNKLQDRPRDFLAATSFTLDEFQQLLPAFQRAYEQRYPYELTRAGTPRQRRPGGGVKGVLPTFEDKLLFILVSQKTHPLHTRHALQFGLSPPQANSWIHQWLPVLHQALAALGLAPERDASRLATHPLLLEGAPAGAIDGTERRRQRPTDARRQNEYDSGKKKTHTDKNIVLVNEITGQVAYLGPTIAGTTPDKKAADAPQRTYPINATLDKDTGFQGYEPERVLTTQPKKAHRPSVERGRSHPESDYCLCAHGGGTRHRGYQTLSDCQRCFAPHY
jgi:hypothetical protein